MNDTFPTGNTEIIIDLGAFQRNIYKIRAVLGEDVTLLPVLKGNTCGHGLVEIANFLLSKCGISMLCVGHTQEARLLRQAGINCDILVLGGVPFSNIPYAVSAALTTAVSNCDYAEALSTEAVKQGVTAKIHLIIDTGLHRMGVRPGDALDALLKTLCLLPNLEIEGAYTHFAASGEINADFTHVQAAAFDRALAQIARAGIHLRWIHAANTPAIVRFPQYHYNMVRSLLLPIGYDWSMDCKNRLNVQQIFQWHGYVAQVNNIRAGECFDYGCSIRAERDMCVAVTDFGYADGYPEDFVQNGAFVIIHGKRAPILSLHMDQGFVDVTDIEDVRVNDKILILGCDGEQEVSLDELRKGTTHSWAYVMSNLGKRAHYIYKY